MLLIRIWVSANCFILITRDFWCSLLYISYLCSYNAVLCSLHSMWTDAYFALTVWERLCEMKLRNFVSRMLWAKGKVENFYLLSKNFKAVLTFSSINFVALGFYLESICNTPAYSERKTSDNEMLHPFFQNPMLKRTRKNVNLILSVPLCSIRQNRMPQFRHTN